MTDAQNIAILQKEVAALQNLVKYMSNATRTVGGNAANGNRLTNDFIKLFLPWLPFVAYLNAPLLVSGGAISTLSCVATIYNIEDNDKLVILNIQTGNQFDIVANGAVTAGATSITFDSFTPTEDLGCNCLILFKMVRNTATNNITIDH